MPGEHSSVDAPNYVRDPPQVRENVSHTGLGVLKEVPGRVHIQRQQGEVEVREALVRARNFPGP